MVEPGYDHGLVITKPGVDARSGLLEINNINVLLALIKTSKECVKFSFFPSSATMHCSKEDSYILY